MGGASLLYAASQKLSLFFVYKVLATMPFIFISSVSSMMEFILYLRKKSLCLSTFGALF
jgi:hypothetical protein